MLSLHPPLSLATLESHMVFVEGGTFTRDMGRRKVHIQIKDFEICRFQVNQQLWYDVMGEHPKELKFENKHRPPGRVSWNEIQKDFLPTLIIKTGANNYCLPTGDQWEYAARGGKTRSESPEKKVPTFWYSGSNHLKEVGWYNENSFFETNLLGCKRPNALGLFDMSGNVFERSVNDSSQSSQYILGGAWYSNPYPCQVSDRLGVSQDHRVGFRLCRKLPR